MGLLGAIYRLVKIKPKYYCTISQDCTYSNCKSFECRYLISCYNTNFEGARGAIQEILKAQTLDEAKYFANIGLMYMDMRADAISKAKEFLGIKGINR